MTNALTRHSFTDTMSIAKVLIASEMLPKAIKTPEQAFVIITMGESLGLNMWQAINGINVIAGKPTVSGQLMLALMYRTGEVEDIQIESSDTAAAVTIKRKGRPSPHREVFTIEDAQRLMTVEWVNNQKKTIRLSEKSTWAQMPAVMLKWRAVAAAARIVFPDAIMGLYTPDEMGADVTVTDDGEMQVINAPLLPSVVERPAQSEQITAPAPMTVEPAPAAEFERRDVTVKSVKRVAVQGGKPVWGFRGYDYSGAEYRFSIESRDSLNDFKEQASGWNTTIGSVTELDKPLDMTVEHEAGYWYFVAVNS